MKLATGATIIATTVALAALATAPASASTAGDDPTPATAQFAENRNLSIPDANSRLSSISERYTQLGAELSPSDSEFIKIYSIGGTEPVLDGRDAVTPGVASRGVASFTFKKAGAGAGGSGAVSGSGRLNNGDLSINNSYSISYTASGSGTVNSIKACAHVKAWGIAGSGGVVLAYYDDPCAAVSGKTNSFSRGKSYTAFVAYSTLQYDVIFNTPTGSFQVAG